LSYLPTIRHICFKCAVIEGVCNGV
jgi:hypothetical protein